MLPLIAALLSTVWSAGDRSSLTLLGGQPELLRRVTGVAKKTIVVLIGGRQLTFDHGQCDTNQHKTKTQATDGVPRVSVQSGVAFPWDPSQSFGAACSQVRITAARYNPAQPSHAPAEVAGAWLQPSLLANVSALVAAWRPGAEGGPALMNLLTGAANPSGRLSVAWPRSVGPCPQLPAFSNRCRTKSSWQLRFD